MQAVILAAGLGTRMGELTKDTPKPLLHLSSDNISMLEHNLHELPEEIDEVVLVVGYLKEQIKELVGDEHAGKKITYIEQKELKGTGHALSICKEVLRDKFLVLMGDDLYKRGDLQRLISEPLSILAWELKKDDPHSFQATLEMDEDGKLKDIVERQPAQTGMLVNAGAYCIDHRYFDLPLQKAGNKTEEFGLPQTLLQLAKNGDEIKVIKATFWHKVTAPEDLE